MTTDILPSGFDFTDPDVNLAGVPHDEFTALRQASPIHWVEQAEPARAGMSTRLRHRLLGGDEARRHRRGVQEQQGLLSRENGVIIRLPETATRESVEMTQVVIINQDAPEHTQLR